MKKLTLVILAAMGTIQSFSQPLFTYGGLPVGKEEFLRAYNKNKTPVADKEQSLKDYLELYTRFKLKVKAALDLRLDTLQQLQYDLQSFRGQVEDGYLNDDKGVQALMDEAISRSQKELHVYHFFVPLSMKAPAADTVKVVAALNDVAAELKKGRSDYATIAEESGKKYIPVKSGDLGFITTFSVSYEMENMLYAMKTGSVSRIIRNKSGFHLFKLIEERASVGRWKVAQVLLAIPPEATAEVAEGVRKQADSLYKLIKGGADFGTIAKNNSQDKLSYMAGGELPEFGTGKYDLAFENNVFALKNEGEVTAPFLTRHGYHIVKLIQHKPTPSDKSDENFVYGLKQQITQDSRNNIAKANFIRSIMQQIGYKRNNAVKDETLFVFADSVVSAKDVVKSPISEKVIFLFAKSNVKGSDWLHFVKDYKLNSDVYKGESNKELLEKYISTAALEYYRKHLEEYNEDFKYQMQEFREGNMLFEIMERNVWSKASNDTAGLKAFYNEHKSKYLWSASADILLFNCSNEKAAVDATTALRNGKDWKLVAEESDGRVQSDSGRYELSQLQLPAGVTPAAGMISAPVVNSTDNTSSFVKILKLYPANQQRSYEEARGLVINEYQNHLENLWIEQLKKKYPVKVNDAVFQSLLK